jgi:hypothetical protein
VDRQPVAKGLLMLLYPVYSDDEKEKKWMLLVNYIQEIWEGAQKQRGIIGNSWRLAGIRPPPGTSCLLRLFKGLIAIRQ